MHIKVFMRRIVPVLALLFALSACSPTPGASSSPAGRLKVVATTTLLGDVVRNIGGDKIDLAVLLPVGTDPHTFEPAPQDIATVAGADLLFTNGAGYEAFLQRLLENAGGKAKVVPVSDGLQLLNAATEGAQESGQGSADPHVWMDPDNVASWTDKIEQALSTADPANADAYKSSADAYRQKLKELDGWISQQVAQIPEADRKLVNDHLTFGYFARRYGFEQVGAVIPGFSSMASPSAQELAGLEDAIRKLNVKAIFVGKTVNSSLSQRVADDTHTRLVFVYTESLSPPDGPASTYLDFMRFDVDAIVLALK